MNINVDIVRLCPRSKPASRLHRFEITPCAYRSTNHGLSRCWPFAGVLTVNAQIPEKNPERNPLALVKSLKCTFPVSATASWKGGIPQAPQVKNEETTFEVESIDAQEGSARLVASDPVYITALLTASSMHFMERTLQGSLTVTTVFTLEGTPGKLRAVRSRHDYLKMSLPGYVSEPAVSQFYGECAPGK